MTGSPGSSGRRSVGYYSGDVARNYDEERFSDPAGKAIDLSERDVLWSLLKDKNSGLRLADVGSGTGRISLQASSMGFETYSVDGSYPMLMLHRSKMRHAENTECELVQGDALRLPLKDDFADIVVAIRVLNQLGNDEERSIAIGELVRICKPEGSIVFDLTNVWSLGVLTGNFDHLSNVSRLIKSITREYPSVRLLVRGRFIVPFKIISLASASFADTLTRVDRKLSNVFSRFCTRTYIRIDKV
jgi:ubiquinone/menaquinone biosynthesis C-methylase UbiE